MATPAETQITESLMQIGQAIYRRDYDRAKQMLAVNTIVVLGSPRLLEHVRRWYMHMHMHLTQSGTNVEKALRLATIYLFESAVVASFPGLPVNHTDRNLTRSAPTFGRVYSLAFSDTLDEGAVTGVGIEPVERFYKLARPERLVRIARFLASGPHSVVSGPTPAPATRLRLFPRAPEGPHAGDDDPR